MSDYIVGYMAVNVHDWKIGDPVYVNHSSAGHVMMLTNDKCCNLREEYNKLSTPIKKKIIALMRIAGSGIKVDWSE
ncbi:hypothetical protein LCGC14_1559220 [marine sediment metagenome]|uniref:Uncharacterized protein n=1 Tax=marine sediment metagenome TaxID=412755 RepID=A0A0F9J906_9ZZZZ